RVSSGSVGEPEGGLLRDARGAFDVDAIDVVLGTGRPVRRRVQPDAVDVFELNPGLALVNTVDGEADRGDVSGRDDALGGLAFVGRDPLVPRRGDLVEHD